MNQENENREQAGTQQPGSTGATEAARQAEEQEKQRLNIDVLISDAGPCRKHVVVRVPRSDIDRISEDVVSELAKTADVPGFRRGRAPRKLIAKRFRREIEEEVRQKVLLQSLEQLTEETDLEPIDEPDLDVEALEIPEEGDFEYEFEVEVRPEFELPEYKGMKLLRPVRDISDEDVDTYLRVIRLEMASNEPTDEPAQPDDVLTLSAQFFHNGQLIREMNRLVVHLRPKLSFVDAEIPNFDQLMTGARKGDVRECDVQISKEAFLVSMRGETVHARFEVKEIARPRLPAIKEVCERLGFETEEELRYALSQRLEQQVEYLQRERAREEILQKIAESATWELPESLVAKQVENAVRRQILEMQQAGFTLREIRARENELRQRAISETREAIKQHFVLDKIATQEKIEVTPADIDQAIRTMAEWAGENPRRLRARLTKSGMIENLEAQVRERRTIELIMEHAEFEDVPIELDELIDTAEVDAVEVSICQPGAPTVRPSEEEGEEAAEQAAGETRASGQNKAEEGGEASQQAGSAPLPPEKEAEESSQDKAGQ